MSTPPRDRRPTRRLLAGLVAGAAALGLSAPAVAAPAPRTSDVVRSTYTNPVSSSFADTFADPAVIRGLDGYWYSYGTSDPLDEDGGPVRRIPTARSSDLVTWDYVGDAFTDANLPTWLNRTASEAGGPVGSVWAPDVRYVGGQYRMYYVVTETTVTGEPGDSAIGMATAPTPVGPWTDSGAPVVGPRRGAGGAGDFLWTFDPSVVTETDGSQWLFYGSYYGGIYVTRLTADGRRTAGTPTQVAIDNKFEGAYPVRHGDYWYLFASTANCCAGPTTGYSVQVGRSRSITGPYRDQQGVSLTTSRAGGTPTLVQNGNAWIGAGHNAVVSDLAGQDWIVYHALDRADPYLVGTEGVNERPMLLDRLDWVDGWPAVRAGRGPSEGARRGPATGGRAVTDFTGGVPASLRQTGVWSRSRDAQSGQLLTSRRAGTVTAAAPHRERVRVEADLRSAGARYGLQVAVGSTTVQARLDPERNRLVLQQSRGGIALRTTEQPLPRPTSATWHAVSLEVRDGRATATVSPARLGDPVATASLAIRGTARPGRAGAFAGGAGVDLDNLSVLPAARLVTELAPDRVPSRLDAAASDEFDGDDLADGWRWVREDAAATVTDGRLRWPTQAADLTGASDDAGVLLRDPGSGSWTVQTKLTTDLGVDQIRNFSQGGLVAYVDDDLFTRLSHVAIWNTRQTEFGKEMPWANPAGTSYGGTIVGPPAETTWLRLTHRLDPENGEHELRAWTSRDGSDWVKGGVWTLPASAEVRVGLISHGGAGATSEFDYFRIYR